MRSDTGKKYIIKERMKGEQRRMRGEGGVRRETDEGEETNGDDKREVKSNKKRQT